jgi:hypothetical protein
MALARKDAVAMLRRAGLMDLAAKAETELPDPVERDELAQFGQRYGLTRDWLASRMGGSP